MNDKKFVDLNREEFQIVERDTKIFDKKFETKPIGYFKDAMIRFGKNKVNVVASIILSILLLSSIIIPVVSTKNTVMIEEQLRFLPPRVPILENFGIYDGYKSYTNQLVDPTTIDPETGLGYPSRFVPEYIDFETLENYQESCTLKDASCVGGQSVLRVDADSTEVAIGTEYQYSFMLLNEPVLGVDVFSVDPGTSVQVYVQPSGDAEPIFIDEITSAGVYEYTMADYLERSIYGNSVVLKYVAKDNTTLAAINSIYLNEKGADENSLELSGFELSQLSIVDGAGLHVRQNGVLLLAAFDYDEYEARLGIKVENNFPSLEYDEILAEYGDTCTQLSDPDPENPNGWIFTDGCPITKVTKVNPGVEVDGVNYFSYNVEIDYTLYSGYTSTPYYFFGTTDAGRDLFTLIWVALRTSLLIGFIASFINITIGIIFGAISGYYGGIVDLLMQRFTEILGRIPWLVTLMIFISFFGPGITTLIFILILTGWIGIAGITRTQFYRYKGREYVLASRTLGAKDRRLIFRHILPNGIGTIITTSILSIPYVIFTESTISYLGYGIGHGQSFKILGFEFSGVSIGVLLADGRTELLTNPHLVLFPAVIISILMITFNMFGNALRDAFNPSLRGSE